MLQNFPTSITAGLSLQCEVICDKYPAPGWELTAILRGPASIDLTAAASGTGHVFTVPTTVTGTWEPGLYAVSIRASFGDNVHEIEAGQTTIAADLVSIDVAHDPRGHAQRTLTAIEAVIEGRANKDQQSYTINGRTLVRTAISDLLMLREKYRAEVAKEKSGGRHNKLVRRKVKVRFGR
ncbi:hypothetical protein [uncultured Ruegeria sp.]|uniref:hypothetical protein n=1 Tax=uncultured Ruegeria sp. TaxID=259304 RepID=UPI002635A2A0|nr:hypothetical protein [uncultured Ruegeria sp.]